MKISGQRLTFEQVLLARMVDELAFISWSKTKDASKNRNRPESVLNKLMHPDADMDKQLEGYTSVDDFQKAWDELVKRGNNDG